MRIGTPFGGGRATKTPGPGRARRYVIIRQCRARAAAPVFDAAGIDTHYHTNIMDAMRRTQRRQVAVDSIAVRIIGGCLDTGEDLASAEARA
jgi:hypothetical protein